MRVGKCKIIFNSSLMTGRYISPIFKKKVIGMKLVSSKHILGIGLENISNILLEIFRSFWICLVRLLKVLTKSCLYSGLVKNGSDTVLPLPRPSPSYFALDPFFARAKSRNPHSSLFAPRKRLLRGLEPAYVAEPLAESRDPRKIPARNIQNQN